MNYVLKLKTCLDNPACSCVFEPPNSKLFEKSSLTPPLGLRILPVWGFKDWPGCGWWHHSVRYPSLESIWTSDLFIFDKIKKNKKKDTTNQEVYKEAFFWNNIQTSKLCADIPRREAGDVWRLPPVWNLRAVIWFHFAISSLVLLPTLSVLSFSACWPFLLNFFKKILQYFSLRDFFIFFYFFCMTPV